MDLVLIEFDNHCLLCRKESCYENMRALYAEMSVTLRCTTLCTCTPEEYSFVIETLGGRAHQRQKTEEVCRDAQKIVDFYRIKERWCGAQGQAAAITCKKHGNTSWVGREKIMSFLSYTFNLTYS